MAIRKGKENGPIKPPAKSKKKPVKCQVKIKNEDGKCVERRFFDKEDEAVAYAKHEKKKAPALTYTIAIYEKFNLLAPSHSYDV